jgi:hypothetical protein
MSWLGDSVSVQHTTWMYDHVNEFVVLGDWDFLVRCQNLLGQRQRCNERTSLASLLCKSSVTLKIAVIVAFTVTELCE